MEPVTAWTVLSSATGATAGLITGMLSKRDCSAYVVGLAITGGLVGWSGYRTQNPEPAPMEAAKKLCIGSAAKGQTAVFESVPGGGYKCSFNPQ